MLFLLAVSLAKVFEQKQKDGKMQVALDENRMELRGKRKLINMYLNIYINTY